MILKSIQEVTKRQIKDFKCGIDDLDVYFKNYALKNEKNGYGKTYVLQEKDFILGFFTLCSSSIDYEEFPTNGHNLLPKCHIPSIRIARLAVDEKYQKQGIGRLILNEAFKKILIVCDTVGVRLIIVDAKETSKTFYEKYGFMRLINDKLTYYLLIDTLKEAIE